MAFRFENLTNESRDFYYNLCRNVVNEFPELEDFYNIVYCFLLTDSSSSAYRQKLKELRLPIRDIPQKFGTSFSFGTSGVIVIRVDLIENKDPDFKKFVISEECCHLVEQEGNCNPSSNSFQEFQRTYMTRGDTFKRSAIILNTTFNHFKVNQMLIDHDFEQWLRHKGNLYGVDFRNGLTQFCTKIRNLDAKERVIKLSVNLLNVVSFYHVVQIIKSQQQSIDGKEIMNQMENSLEETIELVENTITRINPDFPRILNLFNVEVFQNEESFWNKVLVLWSQLKI